MRALPLTRLSSISYACCAYVLSAWATVTSQILLFVLLLGYIVVFRPHKQGTWNGWSWGMFLGLKEFLSLAIPGGMPPSPSHRSLFSSVILTSCTGILFRAALMGCLEWWSFEIIGLAAGSLGALAHVGVPALFVNPTQC